jgi:hypothetical protein
MKCKSHNFAAGGKCQWCGKRKPGRPKNSHPAKDVVSGPAAAPTTDPGAAPGSGALPPPAADCKAAVSAVAAEREARLRSLFAPPPEVHVIHDEPEPERKTTVRGEKEDWAWVAGVATEGIDVASGWATSAWSDLEPMEASASSRKRFAGKLGVFAEQRLGAVEVPTWIVLVICLVALVASKIVGAPKKAEMATKRKPAAPAVPSVPAPTVATSTPVAAAVAASIATPIPPQPKPLTTDGGGSVDDVQSGF